MYNMEQLEERLRNMIRSERWEHSKRVQDEAVKLAARLGADVHRAAVAGILHDCARDMGYEELLNKACEFGIILDSVTLNSPSIIHAVIGPEIAGREFGIKDTDILNAIRYHTTGRENMSLLEKIVFIADAVEPARSYPGVDKIRALLAVDIDKAVLQSLDNTLSYLVNECRPVHLDTVKARNCLLLNR